MDPIIYIIEFVALSAVVVGAFFSVVFWILGDNRPPFWWKKHG